MDIATFLQTASQFRTIPIVRRFFADTFQPIQLLMALRDEAAFLLESKDDMSPWSRYSFIGIRPFVSIESDDGKQFFVKEQQQVLACTATIQEAFAMMQHHLNVQLLSLDVPFRGGAVGYISYDFISSIEKVPYHAYNDLQMKMVHFVVCESLFAFDHVKKELLLIHYVRLTEMDDEAKQAEKYEAACRKIDELARKIVHGYDEQAHMMVDPNIPVSFERVYSNMDKQMFYKAVQNIQTYIASGDVFQAVLSQRFAIETPIDGIELYRLLRLLNPSPYLFYLKLSEEHIVGSSPEKLIQVRNRELEIDPIAGTRRRGKNEHEDAALMNELLHDPKERAEHYMLVDLARNDIGRVAKYGTVRTPQLMQIGKFSHVMHLISKVTGTLRDDVHPLDALLAAFPAGTVSGAPKIRAMQIIQELEPTARNVYAGTIAYIGFDGNIDSCIAIRTAVLKNKVAYVQAGAGVVADSSPALEWKETRNKASALIHAIQLAERVFKGGEQRV
ncbi:anthranilate synthase component I [Anoxybacillus sp. LAT_35]|uniref:anthranilate synthase component I n=1 Tax=Anoxybacillus TaxID=150247 RepID=UPI001ED9D79D|nr:MULTISPECIES: anthranilate synthase component I [Anoxybacillus]MCG5024502.1 anthranilate synthase component I [Anoxybacillus flavithermus]MCG6198518.1 anthranilate synthase component I [Anoxybacillus sp. LAT_38]MCG3083431.1 anthranilate synthase component I [Anoxybacillus sp. LAT27]MCG6172131.1 anthranilate synthase component I [Anoxybacillus sp. LAT_11]MCG6174452.1 anthranilate synthase component I [Anoxybacillus sp. LAT_31]